ncbi:cdc25-like protein phosphatase twine [Drosophila hydei]|uniref:protein-tyrosine-phosphatase n=1 Tax=Drosophila hydei TaxID=7224 RepID=A0A6J2SPN9_DROHY|nr:cdc25-like protein phosphatase twine [Drosophila hydei]
MASKRLSLMLEEQLHSNDVDANLEQRSAKRHKANSRISDESPLQRMLQRQISSGNCAVHLSPITELAHNMRDTQLDGGGCGTPKSSTFRSYNSISSSYDSSNSLDDEYMAMFELEGLEQLPLDKLPGDLDALISGQLKSNENHVACTERHRAVRRCLSMSEQQLEEQQEQEQEQQQEQELKSSLAITPVKQSTDSKHVSMRKVVSMNDADILNALGDEPELIGDLSKPCALPVLLHGVRHRDLKTISCETLARLMRGEFAQLLNHYQIIDCRYPYEYDGGHIRGALNLYTRAQIKDAFPTGDQIAGQHRIYVFHCEFSSERGPKLLRYLRSNDRNEHTHNYPSLDYPELYLLHNGYKEFYASYTDLCEPCNYVPMLAPAHNEEYRLFRAKTKSWQCADSDGGDSGIGGTDGHSSRRGRSLHKSRSRLLYAE